MIENLPNEVWKPIDDFPNYQVSDYGRVKSNIPHNGTNERILKPQLRKDGYLQIQLHKDGVIKNYLVHRLVAETFLPNPNSLPQVNHKNEDKTDNRVSNIEWCDCSYNTNYGTRNNRDAESKSKVVLQFDKQGNFINEWSSTHEVERQLGFYQQNICNCCNGKLHTAYGYKWLYKED